MGHIAPIVDTTIVIPKGLRIGESTDATERTITWDDSAKKYKYHNGTEWVFFGGAEAAAATGLLTASPVLTAPTPLTPANLSTYDIQPLSQESF